MYKLNLYLMILNTYGTYLFIFPHSFYINIDYTEGRNRENRHIVKQM